VPHVWEVESSNPKGWPNLYSIAKVCHHFNIYTVAVLLWHYDVKIAPQTRYTLRRNTAGMMKGFAIAGGNGQGTFY